MIIYALISSGVIFIAIYICSGRGGDAGGRRSQDLGQGKGFRSSHGRGSASPTGRSRSAPVQGIFDYYCGTITRNVLMMCVRVCGLVGTRAPC